VNTHRPLTMIFDCSFDRVFEDKTKKVTAQTINYYKFNTVFSTTLTVIEVLYCLGCMALYLLIIYWHQQGRDDIVKGQDEKFESSDEELDHDT
jgi:hypothetical protein